MCWRIADEIFPGAMFLRDWNAEKWQKLVAAGFLDAVQAHAQMIASIEEPPSGLWETALNDEHRRLGNVEQKGRIALGAVGVVISLTVLVVGPRGAELSVPTLWGATLAFFYLVLGLILGLRANSISMRVYINPEDYAQAADALADGPEKQRTPKVVQLATTLAARDYMAELNRFKVNAADAALRALRNGLLVLAITALVVMWTR